MAEWLRRSAAVGVVRLLDQFWKPMTDRHRFMGVQWANEADIICFHLKVPLSAFQFIKRKTPI